jgi:hypothetical protein
MSELITFELKDCNTNTACIIIETSLNHSHGCNKPKLVKWLHRKKSNSEKSNEALTKCINANSANKHQ